MFKTFEKNAIEFTLLNNANVDNRKKPPLPSHFRDIYRVFFYTGHPLKSSEYKNINFPKCRFEGAEPTQCSLVSQWL